MAVISAALVSLADAQDPCAALTPTTEESCSCFRFLGANFPSQQACEDYVDVAYALFFEGCNFGWEVIEANQAGVDYGLSMVHLTTDENFDPLTPSLGPVLLLHGLFYNDGSPTKGWREWFLTEPDVYDEEQAIPIRLANLGYDVYIGSLRGYPYS